MADFAWAAAGDVGLGVLGGLTKGLTAEGNYKTAAANADAANEVRQANNGVRRSAAGLAATIMSINNERIMNAASDRRDAMLTNALRTEDAFVSRNFETSVKGAETAGRLSAQEAASGLGGAGIEAISRVTSLQLDRQKQAISQGEEQTQYDNQLGIASIIPQAIRGLSTSPIVLGYDQSVNTPPAPPNIAGALIAGLLDKKASLQTALGSLQDAPPASPAAPGASFAFQATSTPVSQSNVTGTDLAPLVSPYPDDTTRFLNQAPTPYANSIDVQNVRTN